MCFASAKNTILVNSKCSYHDGLFIKFIQLSRFLFTVSNEIIKQWLGNIFRNTKVPTSQLSDFRSNFWRSVQAPSNGHSQNLPNQNAAYQEIYLYLLSQFDFGQNRYSQI